MTENEPTILLVEDSEDDVFIMRHALQQAGIANRLQVVTDGQMALDYLSGTSEYSDRGRYPLPFIVFLDLKLPYVDGFEVLAWTRKQEVLDSLIVIILTSSDEQKDHQRAYALGARSYLVKPPKPAELLGVFESLESYWIYKTGSATLIKRLPKSLE